MQQSVTLSFLLLLVVHSSSSATSLLLVTVEAVNNKGPSTVHCRKISLLSFFLSFWQIGGLV